MPRTVDHIVQTHAIAAERRRAGKPIWEARISFAGIVPEGCDVMPEDLSDAQAKDLGRQYAKLMRAHPFFKKHLQEDPYGELDELLQCFEDVCASPEYGESALDDLNARLDELYDWADIHRVWVEVR